MVAYESIIGLETHIQLNTQSKIFCACKADSWGEAPNTNICPVCTGLPNRLDDQGLPIGIQLLGPDQSEAMLPRMGQAYETATNGDVRPLDWSGSCRAWALKPSDRSDAGG
jgi:hypothetical protein